MVYTFDAESRLLSQHDTMADASAALEQGAYTTFRTYGRDRILRLGQHLRRLEESLSLMNALPAAPIDDGRARMVIAHALDHTGYAESRFRLTYGARGLFVSIEAFTPYESALYERGVRCSSVALQRSNPHAKSTGFIASAAQAYKALPAGVHEGLMIAEEDGAILEGLSSNFFAVTMLPVGSEDAEGGVPVLRSEEKRVLIGVTRSLVLEVASGVLPATPIAVRYADLPRVTECFITSVSREIMPVVQIDDLVIGDGTPGPITRELMLRFADLVAREAKSIHA